MARCPKADVLHTRLLSPYGAVCMAMFKNFRGSSLARFCEQVRKCQLPELCHCGSSVLVSLMDAKRSFRSTL
jgi:hypothetical protein